MIIRRLAQTCPVGVVFRKVGNEFRFNWCPVFSELLYKSLTPLLIYLTVHDAVSDTIQFDFLA